MSSNEKQPPLNSKTEAEIIREACINAAKEGFIQASISGLCNEGAVEAAISSVPKGERSKALQQYLKI